MTKDTGGPAFPAEQWVNSNDPKILNPIRHTGMTLRDYFAAKAMQALLGNSELDGTLSAYSELAYKYADAMLKARKA